jgi:hypothetical protein
LHGVGKAGGFFAFLGQRKMSCLDASRQKTESVDPEYQSGPNRLHGA